MKIQSLSVVVPNKKCINNCAFCVSKMHTEDYKNQMDENLPFYDLYHDDYIKRLEFARDNGCNTVVLTGNSEPQQNREFLKLFGIINKGLEKPFRKIDIQTTGVLIDENYLRFLRNHVGVSTVALSVSDIFDSKNNAEINGTPAGLAVDIPQLCALIKKYDFSLRLSLNLNALYNERTPECVFKKAKELGANQITFRELYTSGNNTVQDNWIKNNQLSDKFLSDLKDYILEKGKFLRVLEYGHKLYSVNEMSVVIDDDCMSKRGKEELRYLILRPDCKLYSSWDDKGSLVF